MDDNEKIKSYLEESKLDKSLLSRPVDFDDESVEFTKLNETHMCKFRNEYFILLANTHKKAKPKFMKSSSLATKNSGMIDYKPASLKASNTKKKCNILLLLNELRLQISKECKERGEILSKLWKGYFKEMSNETKRMIQSKNKLIDNFIKEVHKLKEIIDQKNK